MKQHRHARTKFTLIGPWVHKKWVIKVNFEALKDLPMPQSMDEYVTAINQLYAKGIPIFNSSKL